MEKLSCQEIYLRHLLSLLSCVWMSNYRIYNRSPTVTKKEELSAEIDNHLCIGSVLDELRICS